MGTTHTQHTPEPWSIGVSNLNEPCLLGGDNSPIVEDRYCHNETQMSYADAARIVACVNTCKGMTTEQLYELSQVINEGTLAIQQRNELLEALIALLEKYEFNLSKNQKANLHLDDVYISAQEAINKAQGE